MTVTNVETGVAHAYTTNSSGLYVAPFLQPGHYKVEAATAATLEQWRPQNLTLQVGQTLTIDLTLTVKSAIHTVEVSATPLLLDTGTDRSFAGGGSVDHSEPAGEWAQLEQFCIADAQRCCRTAPAAWSASTA